MACQRQYRSFLQLIGAVISSVTGCSTCKGIHFKKIKISRIIDNKFDCSRIIGSNKPDSSAPIASRVVLSRKGEGASSWFLVAPLDQTFAFVQMNNAHLDRLALEFQYAGLVTNFSMKLGRHKTGRGFTHSCTYHRQPRLRWQCACPCRRRRHWP